MEHQSRCSHPQRAQSLDRFRKKRSARCFANQVRYGVRQEVALRSADFSFSYFSCYYSRLWCTLRVDAAFAASVILAKSKRLSCIC